MKADLFKLWFDHGTNPQGRSYEYILIPGAEKEQLESLEKNNPFKIKNDKNIQAVLSKDETFTGIVFYEAGKFDEDFGVEVDKPCVMMLKKKPEGLQVSIADPAQLEKEIQITLNGNFKHDNAKVENGKTKMAVFLPQGEEAGKTITLLKFRTCD
ncbi:MAG: polysaccharide lyase beta-sandwich domain-containing protein [Candidatus Hodarchaeales archaeon]